MQRAGSLIQTRPARRLRLPQGGLFWFTPLCFPPLRFDSALSSLQRALRRCVRALCFHTALGFFAADRQLRALSVTGSSQYDTTSRGTSLLAALGAALI